MGELFKINVHFDENGEELEKIISYFLINKLSSIGRENNAWRDKNNNL